MNNFSSFVCDICFLYLQCVLFFLFFRFRVRIVYSTLVETQLLSLVTVFISNRLNITHVVYFMYYLEAIIKFKVEISRNKKVGPMFFLFLLLLRSCLVSFDNRTFFSSLFFDFSIFRLHFVSFDEANCMSRVSCDGFFPYSLPIRVNCVECVNKFFFVHRPI